MSEKKKELKKLNTYNKHNSFFSFSSINKEFNEDKITKKINSLYKNKIGSNSIKENDFEILDKTIKDLKGTDFFGTIPKFKTSDKLISYLNKLTDGDWIILSSPLRYDNDNSSFWKRHWLSKHNYKPSDAIFTGRKEKYAMNRAYSKGNILIDDKPKNIAKWIAKGGIGILYQANQDSLDYLYNKLTKYYGE